MQPEQMRVARAALNWTLDRLAQESGVHRNTLSNFETRKYRGNPNKLQAVRQTLEDAGVVFVEQNGEAGVAVRRFQRGDIVRFRPQPRAYLNSQVALRVHVNLKVALDERGIVVDIEPPPPQIGSDYRMSVEFARTSIDDVFRFQYELVHTAFTDEEISLLEQLAEHDQTISGNKARSGLARVIRFGYVTEAPLNISDTIHSLTDSGRAVLALWKSTNARPGAP